MKLSKFLYLLLLFICLGISFPCYADTIISADSAVDGKIKAVNSGLITFKSKGVERIYSRAVPYDYYGDSITYVDRIFSKKKHKIEGRVELLDKLSVIIVTPVGKTEIPRYKVLDLVLKI